MPMPWADRREVVYQDMMTEGYDNLKKRYFRTFINNHFDTGVTLYEGIYDTATTSFTYIGNAENPYGGKDTLHLAVRSSILTTTEKSCRSKATTDDGIKGKKPN